MRNTYAKSNFLLLTATFVGLVSMPSLSAGAKPWKEETVLISSQGDQTVVRPFEGDRILFKNADPQLAIEWGLANARTTVVLAGKYVVSDCIDIPRDTLVHSVWQEEQRGKQTFPIVFDGRNDKRTCGVEGGLLLVAGSAAQSCLLLDSRGVHVPLFALDYASLESGLDGVLTLEGCEDCRLGMIVNLAPKPGSTTGETVDLNSRNRGIAIERLVGERSNEIIDCNESHATVDEIVSIGKPQKLLTSSKGSGPRWTSKPQTGSVSLDVKQKTILEDAAGVALRLDVPTLPDALPRFTVRATVEVTLKDGSKKAFAKEAEIDVQSAE